MTTLFYNLSNTSFGFKFNNSPIFSASRVISIPPANIKHYQAVKLKTNITHRHPGLDILRIIRLYRYSVERVGNFNPSLWPIFGPGTGGLPAGVPTDISRPRSPLRTSGLPSHQPRALVRLGLLSLGTRNISDDFLLQETFQSLILRFRLGILDEVRDLVSVAHC